MKKILLGFLAFFVAQHVVLASEGNLPYTPTRLEWTTVYFRNECGFWFGSTPSIAWGLFSLNGTVDTLTLRVIYGDESAKDAAEKAAETCVRNIKASAKDKGWSWLKVTKDVRPRVVSAH